MSQGPGTLERFAFVFRELVACSVYICGGRHPLGKGYGYYHDRYIRRLIQDSNILDAFGTGRDLPEGLGLRLDERVVEYPWLLSRLGRHVERGRALDAGSTLNHAAILQHRAVKAHKWSILTLSPESNCFSHLGISYLYDDLRSTPFRDEWFDIVTCISVIEHVGMDNLLYTSQDLYIENNPNDYLHAICEMKRIMKPGGTLFLSVPFGQYENHGWLQQFNSNGLAAIVSEFQPRKISKTFFRYTLRGWKRACEEECAGLSFSDAISNKRAKLKERYYPGADFAVAARAVACLELEK